MDLDIRISPLSTKQQDEIDPRDPILLDLGVQGNKISGSIIGDPGTGHGFIPDSLLYAYFEKSALEGLWNLLAG